MHDMTFWRLVSPEHFSEAALASNHISWLCLVAVLLAILAAWVLLPVTHRFHSPDQGHRLSWLVAGSVGMGTGIWAMHFTGMLAFVLPVPVSYDPLLTSLSIMPAVLASGCCIYLFKPGELSVLRLHGCGLILAAATVTMHFIGMEAIIVAADMYYVPSYFILSAIAAYLLAVIGLYARVKLARKQHFPAVLATAIGSVILGLAVSSMHFLAMHATYFQANAATVISAAAALPVGLIVSIISITLLLFSLIFFGSVVDRHLQGMAVSLERSENRFQRLAESTHTAIFTFNDSAITYANPALTVITGHQQAFILSASLAEVFSLQFSDWAKKFIRAESHTDEVFYQQFEIGAVNGKPRWLYVSLALVETDNQWTGLGSAIDISQQKMAEQELRQLAYSDPLTKLCNRNRFIDRLGHFLELQRRHQPLPCSCVMILDLDDFKLVNDTYGHLVGDKLLRDVAERISRISRTSDTVARFGGDEFVLLVEGLNVQMNIAGIAERILAELSTPYYLVDRAIPINVSIGVVELDQQNYESCDDVLHDADVALYRAKEEARSCWVLFDSALDASTKRARLIQAELKVALGERQLQLYYQPIFDAHDHSLAGFEALTRWQRSNGEWVSPDEFIDVAEKSGMITDLGLWVLQTACEQLEEWRQLCADKPVYISINVATDSFSDDRFYSDINQLFAQYQFQPGQLKLEITEHMLLNETEHILERLNGLIDLGCELMIDDFGTGYSSLAYLCRLPISTLKIDRSFVAKLTEDKQIAQVVQTIIALAKTLVVKVISEGVETEEQAAQLTRIGSDQLQGYLLGRPMPASEAVHLLPPPGSVQGLTRQELHAVGGAGE
jgi:diguanylate cyclase (GGDEF)-like protein/PAS domain S-box-containing protein